MMADEKQVSAPMRRRDQRLRWENSDTNLASSIPRVDNRKVKFQNGCVFLAACSSGDREEVKSLLESGADINTANVDGLTALHQACIDDNQEMVEFLVELGADVDVCDNEGWTPLHATASCAFTEIARYLLKQGANVAAVNNDGDLPYDIAENKAMENLLQDEMDKQGIDADAARCEEEERMMEHANAMLQDSSVKDWVHPKSGATSLHVAAAKSYLKVMHVLLRTNVDINAEDVEGWTPLHGAVYWGQEDACKILIENFCDMMHKNHAGHTAFDLAEKDMRKLLEELKETQANMRDKQDVNSDIIISSSQGRNRRSSVTRMSGDQKQNVIQRNLDEEKASLAAFNPIKENTGDLNNTTVDSNTTEESETERKNERNKQVSQQLPSQTPSSWARPTNPMSAGSANTDTRRQDMPKIEEVSETDRPSTTEVTQTSDSTSTPSVLTPSSTSSSVVLDSVDTVTTTATTTTPTPATSNTPIATSASADIQTAADSLSTLDKHSSNIPNPDSQPSQEKDQDVGTRQGRDLVSRSISVPAKLPTQKDNSTPSTTTPPSLSRHASLSSSSSTPISSPKPQVTTQPEPVTTSSSELTVPSWRLGLRKTGSTSMVHERMLSEGEDNNLPRSASSPRLVLDARTESLQERLSARRPYSSTGSTISTGNSSTTTSTTSDADSNKPERNSYTFGQSYLGHKSSFGGRSSNYIPYYRRDAANAGTTSMSSTGTATTTTSSSDVSASQRIEERFSHLGESMRLRDRSSAVSTAAGTPTPSTSSSSSVTNTNSVFRRSYEPPKRDEETETQRKARAKHARQTRRSTQGVSLDDIEKAEQVLKSNDATKSVKDSKETSTSSPSSVTTTSSDADSNHLKSIPTTSTATTTIPTSTATPVTTSSVDGTRDDRPALSSSSFRRRITSEDKDKNDLSSTDTTSSLRSSHRRARHDIDKNTVSSDTTSSTDLTSNYVPRSQRNSSLLSSSSDVGSGMPAPSSQGISRSASLRSSRLRNGESAELTTPRISNEDDSTKKDKDAEGSKEEKKELPAIRARRQRRERRSTGIVMDNEEDGEKSKDKPEEDKDKKDETLGSSRFSSRYGSSTDVPSSERSQRPVSYSDFSRSTGSLDIDYKKKYEDEKVENTRLRKELEDTKTSLRRAKEELDAAIKQKDTARNAERDKRALERRVSELEEEMKQMEEVKRENQKLKNDNRALSRVVTRLSK